MTSRFVLPFADVGSGIKPPSGAQLFFFEGDGVTPKDTFTTQSATIANANPVVADSVGVFPAIYIKTDYLVTLKDKNNSQIFGLVPVSEFATVADNTLVKNFDTLALAIADAGLVVGDSLSLKERSTGNGGASDVDVVLLSTVTVSAGAPLVGDTVAWSENTGAATDLALVVRSSPTLDALQLGALGDGSNDDLTAIQFMLDERGDSFIPVSKTNASLYVTSAGPVMNVTKLTMDRAALLKPNPSTVGLTLLKNDLRVGQRVLNDVSIRGDRGGRFQPDTAGTTTGLSDGGSLNTEMNNLFLEDHQVGFFQDRTQEFNGNGAVIQFNQVGHLLSVNVVEGGITASQYSSYRYQGNKVGLMWNNASAFVSGTTTFRNLLVQSNTHCGMAFVSSVISTEGNVDITIDGAHFEANTLNSSDPDFVFQGHSIPAVPLYLFGTNLRLRDVQLGSDDSPAIIMERSTISLHNVLGYGNPIGIFIERRGSECFIFESGACQLIGSKEDLLSYGVPRRDINNSMVEGIGIINRDLTQQNDSFDADPMQVTEEGAIDATSVIVTDTNSWLARRMTFTAAVGSTTNNVIIVAGQSSAPAAGQADYVSFLIRSDNIGVVLNVAYLNSGGSPRKITLKSAYQRVVLTTISNGSIGSIFFWADDTSAPIVFVTAFQTIRGNYQQISKAYSTGAFNPKSGTI